MTVEHPGFAERVFEFAFNAEYCAKHSSVLAACPYLPTQQQEKSLGYDVQFEIKRRGRAVSYLFLQHKVSSFVVNRTGSSAKFYDAAGGPYFAFPLDKDQYNLIHHSANSGVRNILFCAPAFTTRAEMNRRFMARTVVDGSIWIDVAGAGLISDAVSHRIVYDKAGSSIWRFSQSPAKARGLSPMDEEGWTPLKKFDRDSVASIYSMLLENLTTWWPQRREVGRKPKTFEKTTMPDVLPPTRKPRNLLEAIIAVQQLAVEYYGVSWLVKVQP